MRVGGEIRPPGDKSISHRALMLAALAHGRSTLHGVLAAQDTRATARVLRQLGAHVNPLRDGVEVTVRGSTWHAPTRTLHCGNSGTTVRLLLGLLAGQRFAARLTGDASLRRRPMGRVTDPLVAMGARVVTRDDHLPITIRGGALHGITYRTPVASAQVKSAILFAALIGRVDVIVEEPGRSRDHTERLLAFLGLPITVERCTVSLAAAHVPGRRVPNFELTVPGDFSSAAFHLAAAILARDGELVVRDVGVNPTRTGALRVLQRMGATVVVRRRREHGGEPVADLVTGPARLRGTDVAPEEIATLIDEIPVLAVLAAQARGTTRFREVGELRVKESDRLALLAENLRRIGVEAWVEQDDLVVRGAPGAALAGVVHTGGDHRLAMAFGVVAAHTRGRVRLDERRSAAVSYPRFFDDLNRVLRG